MKGAKKYLWFVWYFSGFLVVLMAAVALWGIAESAVGSKNAWINQSGNPETYQPLDCRQLAAVRASFSYVHPIPYRIKSEGPQQPGLLLPDSVLLDFSGLQDGVAEVRFAQANHAVAAFSSLNSVLPAILWALLFIQVWIILKKVLHEGAFFKPDFPKRIRWMALIIIALPLQETAREALLNLWYANLFALPPSDLDFGISAGIIPALLLTLILLALAEVADYGHALEEDQKLTI